MKAFESHELDFTPDYMKGYKRRLTPNINHNNPVLEREMNVGEAFILFTAILSVGLFIIYMFF